MCHLAAVVYSLLLPVLWANRVCVCNWGLQEFAVIELRHYAFKRREKSIGILRCTHHIFLPHYQIIYGWYSERNLCAAVMYIFFLRRHQRRQQMLWPTNTIALFNLLQWHIKLRETTENFTHTHTAPHISSYKPSAIYLVLPRIHARTLIIVYVFIVNSLIRKCELLLRLNLLLKCIAKIVSNTNDHILFLSPYLAKPIEFNCYAIIINCFYFCVAVYFSIPVMCGIVVASHFCCIVNCIVWWCYDSTHSVHRTVYTPKCGNHLLLKYCDCYIVLHADDVHFTVCVPAHKLRCQNRFQLSQCAKAHNMYKINSEMTT